MITYSLSAHILETNKKDKTSPFFRPVRHASPGRKGITRRPPATSTKDQHKSGFGERVKDEFAEARKPS